MTEIKTKHIDFSIIDYLNINIIFLMYERKMKDSLVNIIFLTNQFLVNTPPFNNTRSFEFLYTYLKF